MILPLLFFQAGANSEMLLEQLPNTFYRYYFKIETCVPADVDYEMSLPMLLIFHTFIRVKKVKWTAW